MAENLAARLSRELHAPAGCGCTKRRMCAQHWSVLTPAEQARVRRAQRKAADPDDGGSR